MGKIVAALLVSALTLGLAAPAVYAGDTATDVALGLASFAVFNQIVGPFLYPSPAPAAAVYVYEPPPPQVVVIQPPPARIVVVQAPRACYGPPGHCKRWRPSPWAGHWRR